MKSNEYYQSLADRIPEDIWAEIGPHIEALEMFSGPLTREDVAPLFVVWWKFIEYGRPSTDINCAQCRVQVVGHFRQMMKTRKNEFDK